jgi:alkanesulfonate monooxygenase SsuD/methylene tetrahydromethanopterin reductase-like flavin-dependent oxidoreductase (luciferase family)
MSDTGDPVKDTGEPLEERTAIGSPADVARVIGTYAAAGATSVVLQPTGDDPDVDATLALGAEAIALLAR